MPKSRRKSGTSKNVGVSSNSGAPTPLFESLQAQKQSSREPSHTFVSDTDNFDMSTAGWQCDIDDWTDKNASKNRTDVFPRTLRSIERENEQMKNPLFQFRQIITNKNENKSEMNEHTDERTSKISSRDIDIFELTTIIADLISGKCDNLAYKNFLTMLQQFSVHASREDHLEETVYHLIQAGVSFIRSNEGRFDPSKLHECYRQRCLIKMNAFQ